MWRRASSNFQTLARSLSRRNQIPVQTLTNRAIPSLNCLLSTESDLKKKVEDVTSVATGLEREVLLAELEGRKMFDMDAPKGPFGTKIIGDRMILPRWFSSNAEGKPTELSNAVKEIMGDGMIEPRWFSSNAEGKPTKFSTAVKEEVGQMAKIPAKSVTCFSPLEAVSVKPRRSSGLGNESLKIKRTELFDKITFALIPALILTSKGPLTTSILVLSVYWQVYGFFKEIFLDYVHQEVTRKWVLIYLQILFLILAKDTFLNFGLV